MKVSPREKPPQIAESASTSEGAYINVERDSTYTRTSAPTPKSTPTPIPGLGPHDIFSVDPIGSSLRKQSGQVSDAIQM